jgi:hypothetical protein
VLLAKPDEGIAQDCEKLSLGWVDLAGSPKPLSGFFLIVKLEIRVPMKSAALS